jgi:hypothetical protein
MFLLLKAVVMPQVTRSARKTYGQYIKNKRYFLRHYSLYRCDAELSIEMVAVCLNAPVSGCWPMAKAIFVVNHYSHLPPAVGYHAVKEIS